MSSGALFVEPITIATGGALTSTTAGTSGDPAAWGSGATFGDGDQATYGESIYQSLQAANTGKQPDLLVNADWWVRVGAINKMKMFDRKVGSQTENPNSIAVVITPAEFVGVIALRNVEGQSVTVMQETVGEGEVYTRTLSLVEPVDDWLVYFFGEIITQNEAIFTGLAQYTDAAYTITISNPGGVAKCGELIMGPALEPGRTLSGGSDGIDDYSVIAADEFGVRDIVEREYADNTDQSIMVEKARSPMLRRFLTRNRARAFLFIPSDARPDLQVYGFAESWRRVMSYPAHDVYNITMRGLT